MARKDGIDDLRNDRVLISDNAGEDRLLRAEAADEVLEIGRDTSELQSPC